VFFFFLFEKNDGKTLKTEENLSEEKVKEIQRNESFFCWFVDVFSLILLLYEPNIFE
jgi:hypothetical protein